MTWNHLADTIETIESFIFQDYQNFKLIVVDNNSKDNTAAHIKKRYPQIFLIENKKNMGWAAGNNIGIKYALENGAGYVLLVNNDIIIDDKKLLSDLIDSIQRTQLSMGVFGVSIFNYYQKDLLLNKGHEILNNNKFTFNRQREKNHSIIKTGVTFVDFVEGSFMLIKASLIMKIGFFDENYFLYCDDRDFCYRAWLNGFESVVFGKLQVFHKKTGSSKEYPELKTYYMIRNQFLFLKKFRNTNPHYNYFIKIVIWSLFKNLVRYLLFPKRYNSQALKLFWTSNSAFIDGFIFNKKGPNLKFENKL